MALLHLSHACFVFATFSQLGDGQPLLFAGVYCFAIVLALFASFSLVAASPVVLYGVAVSLRNNVQNSVFSTGWKQLFAAFVVTFRVWLIGAAAVLDLCCERD